MINIVNRVDNADGVVASHSPNMRFWSPGFIIGEFEKLAETRRRDPAHLR